MSSFDQENLSHNSHLKEILSSQDPYKFKWVDNTYLFITELGLTYSVYFSACVSKLYIEYDNWCNNVYEMGFDVKGGLPDDFGHDKRIEETIISIVSLFFKNNENILLYVCETLDGDEFLRYRLFNQWFFRYNKEHKTLEKLNHNGNLCGTKIYSSFIFNKNHPFYNEVIVAFTEVCNNIYND